MEADKLFTLDVVRDFISEHGGKVPNHALVTHFRGFLNDPVKKVANRAKFKEYVNTLAVVKLDKSGEKLLVLRKQYRNDYIPPDQQTKESKLTKVDAPKAKLKDSFPRRLPSEDGTGAGSSGQFSSTENILSAVDEHEDDLLSSIQKQLGLAQIADSTTQVHDTESFKDEEFQSTTDEPFDTFMSSKTANDTDTDVFEDALDDLPRKESSSKTELDRRQLVQEDMTTAAPPQVQPTAPQPKEVVVAKAYCPPAAPSLRQEPVKQAPSAQLASSDSNSFHSLPGSSSLPASLTSSRHNTPEGDLQTRSEQVGGRASSLEPSVPQIKSAVSVKAAEDEMAPSVKDRAKHLNKITATQLPDLPQNLKKSSGKRLDRNRDDQSIDSTSSLMIAMDSDERQWMLFACKGDYHELAKLLHRRPDLAPKRDFITGFTALHWACKKGNADIVKLLFGTKNVHVNVRSNGGYTPLHVAAMHSHEHIIELLVQTYGADTNVRDYSGRKPKQYLRHSASSRANQLLQSSRLSHASVLNYGADPTVKRSSSISSKMKAIGQMGLMPTSLLKNSWGNTGDRAVRASTSNSPSPSPVSSPGISRKGSVVSAPGETELMPPPLDIPPRKKRNKSNHSKQSLKDGNMEMTRAGSDTMLATAKAIDQARNMHPCTSYSSMV